MSTGSESKLVETVLAEIDDEVRRRRAAGDFPPSLERRLDRLFSRFTPVGVDDDRFAETLRLADRSAYMDIEVPVLSQRRGVRRIKSVLRALMAWYLNYLVQQITHFSSATMRVLHMLDDRTVALEDEAAASRPAALSPDELGELDAALGEPAGDWLALARERLRGVGGRVLHAECGSGKLVAALVGDGGNAYGVEPRSAPADAAVAAGLDVRLADPLEHLRAVSEAGLAGLALTGVVDRLTVRHQRELARLAGRALVAGGALVLVGSTPSAWARRASVVVSDLAPGRPLHAETWVHLLAEEGFTDLEVLEGPSLDGLGRMPGEDPAAAAMNLNLERIDAALFGPASFAVVAVRRR